MDTVFPVMNAQSTVPIPTPWSPWRIPMESTSVVVRQHKSNVVFTYLYGLFRISDISLGNVSVGIIGSIQRFASAIPKPIIKNPNAKYSTFNAIVFGRSASHASWTSIIFPKPIPTTKEKIYSKQNAFFKIISVNTSIVWKM